MVASSIISCALVPAMKTEEGASFRNPTFYLYCYNSFLFLVLSNLHHHNTLEAKALTLLDNKSLASSASASEAKKSN